MAKRTLIHLSDLHIGRREIESKRVKKAFNKIAESYPGIPVLITGDLTDSATKGQLEKTRKFLDELAKTNHGFKGSFGDFCVHVDQINEMLQNNTKWRLTETLHFIKSLPPAENIENEVYQLEATKNNSNHHSSQEDQIISSDRTEIIKDVLNQIPPEEQLIIKLRFFRGLPLDQIARLLKMKNLWRVRRKLQKALKLIRKKLKEKGIEVSDI